MASSPSSDPHQGRPAHRLLARRQRGKRIAMAVRLQTRDAHGLAIQENDRPRVTIGAPDFGHRAARFVDLDVAAFVKISFEKFTAKPRPRGPTPGRHVTLLSFDRT